jgi:GNAT superfamily N-acetyltransferase
MDGRQGHEAARYALRRATPADAPVLTWLDAVATPDADTPPPATLDPGRPWRCRLPRDLARRQIVMVAGHAAGVVATARGTCALVVTDLRLLPACHARGVGRALLEDLLAEARRAGLALTLRVRKGAPGRHQRARLEQWGFAPSGETATHWRLTQPLAPGQGTAGDTAAA